MDMSRVSGRVAASDWADPSTDAERGSPVNKPNFERPNAYRLGVGQYRSARQPLPGPSSRFSCIWAVILQGVPPFSTPIGSGDDSVAGSPGGMVPVCWRVVATGGQRGIVTSRDGWFEGWGESTRTDFSGMGHSRCNLLLRFGFEALSSIVLFLPVATATFVVYLSAVYSSQGENGLRGSVIRVFAG